MIIELNIGLNVEGASNSDLSRDYRATDAIKALLRNPITQNVLGFRRAQSATEDTLVVQLSVSSGVPRRLRADINALACQLRQDCIAVYNSTEFFGELVGPNAAAWGDFNPDYFIRFDAAALKPLHLPRGPGTDALANKLYAQRAA